jgi:dGTPase
MIRIRAELEKLERDRLAPYAQRSGDTAGRKHPEPPHPHRLEYERDRARIIHSQAFRRLEYKTQVFLNGTGDHYRTRLTHTMEVASISRTISRGLGLNEDLTETIALAHDLGHPPFGHSGEETLNRLMQGHGGFDHNAQSLRVVELIEQKYPRFPGLNLTWEVREGLRKHARSHDSPKVGGGKNSSPSLEAQVADLADEITYYSHDLDDGLDSGLIEVEQLAELDVWSESAAHVKQYFPKLKGRELAGYIIRCLIDRQVQDVITASAAAIAKAGVTSAKEVRQQSRALIRYSEPLRRANAKLRKFLYANLYFHESVAGVNKRACELLARVFEAYLDDPRQLGRTTAKRLNREGLQRTVCDFLSGMTDRYVIQEHQRLFGSGL